MTRRSLNKKQQLFVDEYLTDFNATQAAVRAGYSAKSARWIASRSLRNPVVKAAIAEAQAPRLAALRLSADEVLCQLALVARANMLDYLRIDDKGTPDIDLAGLTPDKAAAIRDIRVERIGEGDRRGRRITIRMHDKLAALDRLARHYGLFRETPDLAGEDAAEPDAPAERPHYDARQTARAILAIFREAAEEDAAEAAAEAAAAAEANAVEAIGTGDAADGAEADRAGRWRV